MNFNLKDEDFLSFLEEVIENQALNAIFSVSPYWEKGGEQAINLICNSHFYAYPKELIKNIQLIIDDVCPEQCSVCCCPINWNQMSQTLLNGDGLCEYHHNLNEKLDKE